MSARETKWVDKAYKRWSKSKNLTDNSLARMIEGLRDRDVSDPTIVELLCEMFQIKLPS